MFLNMMNNERINLEHAKDIRAEVAQLRKIEMCLALKSKPSFWSRLFHRVQEVDSASEKELHMRAA